MLIKGQILINIRELSVQRAHIKIINVGKSFTKVQIVLCTTVSLLKRRLTDVVTLAKPLTSKPTQWQRFYFLVYSFKDRACAQVGWGERES